MNCWLVTTPHYAASPPLRMLEETLEVSTDESVMIAALEGHEKLQAVLARYDELVAKAAAAPAVPSRRSAAAQRPPAAAGPAPQQGSAVSPSFTLLGDEEPDPSQQPPVQQQAGSQPAATAAATPDMIDLANLDELLGRSGSSQAAGNEQQSQGSAQQTADSSSAQLAEGVEHLKMKD